MSLMITLNDVHFELTDLSLDLVQAWRHVFHDRPNVHAKQESILEANTCALVSPANSFGFMDGGLDLVLSEHFGWQMEHNVRKRLLAEFDGELPVGHGDHCPYRTQTDSVAYKCSYHARPHVRGAYYQRLSCVSRHFTRDQNTQHHISRPADSLGSLSWTWYR